MNRDLPPVVQLPAITTRSADEIIDEMISNGQLSDKHAPDSGYVPAESFRSILTREAADKLDSFVGSRRMTLMEYQDNRRPGRPQVFYKVIPHAITDFTDQVGLPSGSNVPVNPPVMDQLLYVSGSAQGPHFFADYTDRLQKAEDDEKIVLLRVLNTPSTIIGSSPFGDENEK